MVDKRELAGRELRVVVVTKPRIFEASVEGFFLTNFHTNCPHNFKALHSTTLSRIHSIDTMTTNDGGYYFSRREEEERSFDPRDFIRDVMHLSNNSFPEDDDDYSSNWKDEKRRFAQRRRGGQYDTVTQNTIDEERNRLFEKKRQIGDHDDENAHRERTSLFNKGRSVEAKFGFKTNNNNNEYSPSFSYPQPSTVERQRRAQERVTAALRKLKIERNLEKTPEVVGGFGGYAARRRRFLAKSESEEEEEEESARTYRTRRRVVSATEKEHFLKTPSPQSSSRRMRDSLNSNGNVLSDFSRKATKVVSPLGPPRRVPVENSNNSSPNLISFSPLQMRGSALKKTPVHISPLGPPRRVLKIDQENDVSFSNNNNNYSSKYSSPAVGSTRRMYNTPENRVYPTPETKQTQEKLKKSLLERLSKIANDSPPSSRKSYNGFTARL